MKSIDIQGLTKIRESDGAGFHLKVDEFHVVPGEFVVIVGASGCGKSTLMDMIALVLRPTSSNTFEYRDIHDKGYEIQPLWDRNDENSLASIRRIFLGYVLQAGGLFPYLSIRENALVPRKLKSLALDTPLMEEMAMAIGLAGSGDDGSVDYSLLDKKPRHLSGGQRQRAAIMRALLSEPAIILADEPTAAVDEITGRSIIQEFKNIARERSVSVVMVTHDRHLVRGHVDRAYTFEVSREENNSGNVVSKVVNLPLQQL